MNQILSIVVIGNDFKDNVCLCASITASVNYNVSLRSV